MFKINDNIIIIDIISNAIIAAGEIKTVKDNYLVKNKYYKNDIYAISIDTKYFFNINSKKFIIRYNTIDQYEKAVQTDLLQNFNIALWNSTNKNNIDIFIENTIDELDVEVIKLINALNKIPFITTTGSCSGHNKNVLWISFGARNISSLIFISKIINNKFNGEFNLSTKRNRSLTSNDALEIALITTCVGKKAYKFADLLADEIITELKNKN